jgi:CheY-like chemotaxis protein
MAERLRVLVVEDEMAVALMIEDMLTDLGHEVVGIAMRLHQGMGLAATAPLDIAILDVNLNGRMSFPIADLLAERGVPFVFATGYGAAGVEDRYRDRALVVTKPFRLQDLQSAIERAAH